MFYLNKIKRDVGWIIQLYNSIYTYNFELFYALRLIKPSLPPVSRGVRQCDH